MMSSSFSLHYKENLEDSSLAKPSTTQQHTPQHTIQNTIKRKQYTLPFLDVLIKKQEKTGKMIPSHDL